MTNCFKKKRENISLHNTKTRGKDIKIILWRLLYWGEIFMIRLFSGPLPDPSKSTSRGPFLSALEKSHFGDLV